MRKTFLAVVMTLICVLSLCAFTACDKLADGQIVDCEHTWMEIEAVEATCLTGGNNGYKYCIDCGEFSTEPIHIPPLGHSCAEECTADTCRNVCVRCGLRFDSPDSLFNFSTLKDGSLELSVKEDAEIPECIVIPEMHAGKAITAIALGGFSRCTNLKHVVIPKSITSIGYSAFSSCTQLARIDVDEENTRFMSNDGVLYTEFDGALGTSLIQYPATKTGKFVLPNEILSIEDNAFYKSQLESINLNTINFIGNAAFYGSALTSIYIPNTVITVESNAFSNCTALTEAKIGNSVTAIYDSLFYGCTALENVYIPASVQTISSNAFNNCPNLKLFEVESLSDAYVSIDKNLYSFYSDTYTLVQCVKNSLGDKDYFFVGSETASILPRAFVAYDSPTFPAIIIYEGTKEEWAALVENTNHMQISYSLIYFYNENTEEAGNYWHYDADGEIVIA